MILSAHTAARMMLCIDSDDDAIMTALDAYASDTTLDPDAIDPALCDFIAFLAPTDRDIDAIDRALRALR